MIDQIIIPRPDIRRGEAPYKTPERRWEEVTKEMYGSADLPQNIPFDHDPDWRNQFLAIENIRAQRGVWFFVGLLFTAAGVGLYPIFR